MVWPSEVQHHMRKWMIESASIETDIRMHPIHINITTAIIYDRFCRGLSAQWSINTHFGKNFVSDYEVVRSSKYIQQIASWLHVSKLSGHDMIKLL